MSVSLCVRRRKRSRRPISGLRQVSNDWGSALRMTAALQQSTTFRAGAWLTLPLRILKAGTKGYRISLTAPPTQAEIDRRGAPVKPRALTAPKRGAETKPAAPPASSIAVGPHGREALRESERKRGRSTRRTRKPRARAISRNASDIRAFYENNGFALIRGVLPEAEAVDASKKFKEDFVLGDIPPEGHTTFDIASVCPEGEDYAFDPRIPECRAQLSRPGHPFSCNGQHTQLNHMSFSLASRRALPPIWCRTRLERRRRKNTRWPRSSFTSNAGISRWRFILVHISRISTAPKSARTGIIS